MLVYCLNTYWLLSVSALIHPLTYVKESMSVYFCKLYVSDLLVICVVLIAVAVYVNASASKLKSNTMSPTLDILL
jgi:uncharacterized membrane protein (DUF4010 family)